MEAKKIIMTDPRKTDHSYEEAIKTLRTNIQYAGRNIKVIVLTSCYPNEGKSDITFQLAKEIGNLGRKVLLLDADIRKSSFISRFDVQGEIQGLSQYLSGQVDAGELICQTNYPNMDIIFAGHGAPNPSELLEEEAFGVLMGSLRKEYDYIIIDTPPLANVVDANIVAKHCDGVVMVIESDSVSYKMAQKVIKHLSRSGCRVLGAALNKVDTRRDKYYARYSYYYSREESGGRHDIS